MKIKIKLDANFNSNERDLYWSMNPIVIDWDVPILPPKGSTFQIEKFFKLGLLTVEEYELFLSYHWVVAFYVFTKKDNDIVIEMQLDGE